MSALFYGSQIEWQKLQLQNVSSLKQVSKKLQGLENYAMKKTALVGVGGFHSMSCRAWTHLIIGLQNRIKNNFNFCLIFFRQIELVPFVVAMQHLSSTECQSRTTPNFTKNLGRKTTLLHQISVKKDWKFTKNLGRTKQKSVWILKPLLCVLCVCLLTKKFVECGKERRFLVLVEKLSRKKKNLSAGKRDDFWN